MRSWACSASKSCYYLIAFVTLIAFITIITKLLLLLLCLLLALLSLLLYYYLKSSLDVGALSSRM